MTDNQRLSLAKLRQLYRDLQTLKAVAYELEISKSAVWNYLHRRSRPSKQMSYWILTRQ